MGAQALLECEDVVVWSTDWCVKPMGTPFRFSWHQDSTYSKFTGRQGVTVWLAFSDVTKEHGPLLFRPGTHKLGQLYHYENETDGENMLAFGQTIPDSEDSRFEQLLPEQRAWNESPTAVGSGLRPGTSSAHSFEVIHSSQANVAGADRV